MRAVIINKANEQFQRGYSAGFAELIRRDDGYLAWKADDMCVVFTNFETEIDIFEHCKQYAEERGLHYLVLDPVRYICRFIPFEEGDLL